MLELSNVWAWRGLIRRSLEPLGSCDPKVLVPFRVLLLLHCMLSGDRQASFWPGASRESIPLGLVLWPHEFRCYMVERVMPCVGLNMVCARTNVYRILILSAERWKVLRRRLRPEAALSSGNRCFLPRLAVVIRSLFRMYQLAFPPQAPEPEQSAGAMLWGPEHWGK